MMHGVKLKLGRFCCNTKYLPNLVIVDILCLSFFTVRMCLMLKHILTVTRLLI